MGYPPKWWLLFGFLLNAKKGFRLKIRLTCITLIPILVPKLSSCFGEKLIREMLHMVHPRLAVFKGKPCSGTDPIFFRNTPMRAMLLESWHPCQLRIVLTKGKPKVKSTVIGGLDWWFGELIPQTIGGKLKRDTYVHVCKLALRIVLRQPKGKPVNHKTPKPHDQLRVT